MSHGVTYWHSLDKIKMQRPFGVFCFFTRCWKLLTNNITTDKKYGPMRLRLVLRNLKIVSHCVTYWHSLDKIKMRRPLESFVSYKMMIERTDKEGKGGPSFTIVGWFLPSVIHSDLFWRILSKNYQAFLLFKLMKLYWSTENY